MLSGGLERCTTNRKAYLLYHSKVAPDVATSDSCPVRDQKGPASNASESSNAADRSWSDLPEPLLECIFQALKNSRSDSLESKVGAHIQQQPVHLGSF